MTQPGGDADADPPKRGRFLRAGIALIALSFVCWLGVPLAPLVAGASGTAGAIAGTSFVLAELTFWAGVALAGRATWTAIKLDGWRKLPFTLLRMLKTGQTTEPAGDALPPRPPHG